MHRTASIACCKIHHSDSRNIVAELLFDGSDHATGITIGEHTGRDVAGDHATGSDDRSRSYGHPGEDAALRPDPYVVTDGDGQGAFPPFAACGCIERVGGGVDAYVGTDEHVVADGDGGTVEDDEIHISKAVVTDADIIALVAEEGTEDERAVAQMAEEVAQYGLALGEERGSSAVKTEELFLAVQEFRLQLRVVGGIVEEALRRLFFLCHRSIAGRED